MNRQEVKYVGLTLEGVKYVLELGFSNFRTETSLLVTAYERPNTKTLYTKTRKVLDIEIDTDELVRTVLSKYPPKTPQTTLGDYVEKDVDKGKVISDA